MAIKIDLEKAYDCLNWGCLKDTLSDCKLPEDLVSVIIHCVTSVSMQICGMALKH